MLHQATPHTLLERTCACCSKRFMGYARQQRKYCSHVQYANELADGLKLYRCSCPIGVIGVIFESRPDALVQISSLCLKSGNAVLLKGGREAMQTNEALYQAILAGSREAGLPEDWCHLLHTRQDVDAMLKQDDCIDLIIPRGSNAFVRHIMKLPRTFRWLNVEKRLQSESTRRSLRDSLRKELAKPDGEFTRKTVNGFTAAFLRYLQQIAQAAEIPIQ